MSSSSSNFHLISKALSDYAKQTGIDLTTNPFADQFHSCDSAEAISELLQGRVEAFKDYRDEHRKLIKGLNPVFQFLHVFSATLGNPLVLVSTTCTQWILFLLGLHASTLRYHFHLRKQSLSASMFSSKYLFPFRVMECPS